MALRCVLVTVHGLLQWTLERRSRLASHPGPCPRLWSQARFERAPLSSRPPLSSRFIASRSRATRSMTVSASGLAVIKRSKRLREYEKAAIAQCCEAAPPLVAVDPLPMPSRQRSRRDRAVHVAPQSDLDGARGDKEHRVAAGPGADDASFGTVKRGRTVFRQDPAEPGRARRGDRVVRSDGACPSRIEARSRFGGVRHGNVTPQIVEQLLRDQSVVEKRLIPRHLLANGGLAKKPQSRAAR